jgi:hypothetical protein
MSITKVGLIVAMVAVTFAQAAAQFVLDAGFPQGGTSTGYQPPPPVPDLSPYSVGSDGFYGNSRIAPGASCSGTVKYRWTWTGAVAAPATVLLKVEARAGYVVSEGGKCANGLGHPTVKSPIAGPGSPEWTGISSGTAYIRKEVNNGILEYEIEPTASAPTGATCQVGVRVTPITNVANLDVTVQVTTAKVAGLTFDTTKHRHEAAFGVKATAVNPAPGATLYYRWSSAGSGGTLEFDNPNAQTTTARAVGPMKGYPTCTVVAVANGNHASGTDSRVCAAIGGPITTTISTPAGMNHYLNDGNDPAKSRYLTNYGYSHASAAPAFSQATQRALLSVGGQPTGTTVTWTLPNSTYSPTLQTNPNATQIEVCAEGPFQDGVPVAHFSFSGDGISGTADDDSATTQVQQGTGPSATWVALVYKLSGHQPKELTDEIHPADQTYTPASGAVAWTNYAFYKYRLKDTFGDPMPGVWVQERFTTPVPAGFRINGNNEQWTTLRVSTPSAPGMHADDGYFHQWDRLWFTWGATPTTTVSFTHVYFAGNRNTASTATTGINLGAYTMTFTPGQPGTATQAKNP